jgi:hypothetical protein
MWRPGDLVLGEEAFVPLCNLRRVKCSPRTPIHLSMGRNWRKRYEEGRFSILESMIEELVGALGHDVGRILTDGVGWRCSVLRGADVVVLVRKGVKEEVGLSIATDWRRGIVMNVVSVEELPHVVGIVA